MALAQSNNAMLKNTVRQLKLENAQQLAHIREVEERMNKINNQMNSYAQSFTSNTTGNNSFIVDFGKEGGIADDTDGTQTLEAQYIELLPTEDEDLYVFNIRLNGTVKYTIPDDTTIYTTDMIKSQPFQMVINEGPVDGILVFAVGNNEQTDNDSPSESNNLNYLFNNSDTYAVQVNGKMYDVGSPINPFEITFNEYTASIHENTFVVKPLI